MIRTQILRCDLPKADADALNHASGLVYSRTLVTHYRVYRKKGNKHRKAEAEGMVVVLVDEHDTSKTCPNPNCTGRHKPAGRIYRCPVCGFQAHRDVVGAVNILSRQVPGDVGKIRPPPTTMYRHPVRPGKRSGPDTGQPATVVACGTGSQPQEAVSL